MIDKDFVRTMARYNMWQNGLAFAAASTLTDAQRREDRGAFFGSIHRTLSHILWADGMWMSRLDGWDRPPGGPDDGDSRWTWEAMTDARREVDRGMGAWADRISDDDLAGDLTWYSGVAKSDLSKPMWIAVTHLFNHQTHHRGQVHALLTSFGVQTEATDLAFMPDET